MDGLTKTIEVLRRLVNYVRLTPYERDALKYALVVLEEVWEIEQTFDKNRG